jgi:hypothetical protein
MAMLVQSSVALGTVTWPWSAVEGSADGLGPLSHAITRARAPRPALADNSQRALLSFGLTLS